jgi:hypothetical protein
MCLSLQGLHAWIFGRLWTCLQGSFEGGIRICARDAAGEKAAKDDWAAGQASAWAQLVTSTAEPAPETFDITRREDALSDATVPAVKPSDVRKSVEVFDDKRTSLETKQTLPISQ